MKDGNRIFIHAYDSLGIVEPRRYSLKPLKRRKGRDRANVYFEPIPGQEIDLMEFNGNMQRGRKFFTVSDGFLFGALVELGKTGKIVKEEL